MKISISNKNLANHIHSLPTAQKSHSAERILKCQENHLFQNFFNTNKNSYIKKIVDQEDTHAYDLKKISKNQNRNVTDQKDQKQCYNFKFFGIKNKKVQNADSDKKERKINRSLLSKRCSEPQIERKGFLTHQKKNQNKQDFKSSQFVDKHIITTKKCVTNDFSIYRKFDITKLDFSSGFSTVSGKSQPVEVINDQYSRLVYKSVAHIKKIIELNKILKEDKKINKNQLQKPEIKNSCDNIQIIQQIKAGCFGTIYKAKMLSTGKFVAVKSFPYDRKFQQREVQICQFINNPFVVKVYQIYYTNQVSQCQKQNQAKIPGNKRQSVMKSQNWVRPNTTSKTSFNRLSKLNLTDISRFSSQFSELRTYQTVRKQEKKASDTLQEHIRQFHDVTNIVMDLYDLDLDDYISIKNKIDDLTLKIFCYQMLRSVLYLHSNNICHRDIKPHNFFVKKHMVVLGDFGSAKVMRSNRNSNVSYICSRYYRAPELIFGYKFYDKSIDIWSLGTVMAQIQLGKPLFNGANSLDQLVKIIKVIGEPEWRKISFMVDKIPKIPEMQPKGLKSIFSVQVNPLFIDLLQNMLKFNPLQRITAGQALAHPYFDEIRDQRCFEQICKQMDISHFLKFSRDQLKQNEHLKNKLIPAWITKTQKFDGTKSSKFFRS